MFSVLIESATVPARRGRWFAGSAVLHSAIALVAIVATFQRLEGGPEPVETVSTIVFTRPAPAAAPASPRAPSPGAPTIPARAVLPRFDVAMPQLPPLDQATTFTLDANALAIGDKLAPSGILGGVGDSVVAGGVLTPNQVDRVVVAHGSNGAPRYPSTLRAAGLEGEVLVQFVVDTLGRVERGSIRIVRAAHDSFAEAVTAWLLRNRYAPAEIGGRAVRQMVEQRVDFGLKKN